jgi:autotransporter-associated beta strand protein
MWPNFFFCSVEPWAIGNMKNVRAGLVIVSFLAFAAGNSNGDTAWSSTSSSDWGTIANWTNGLPSTGPQRSIYPGAATLQKSVNLGGTTARETLGMQFNLVAGGTGYTFTGLPSVAGFFVRAGGTANGIINSDDSTATFNVPIKLLDNSGNAGPGAAMTWNAAAGNMVFNGVPNTSSPWTLNLNGAAALTINGSFNVSIGTSGPGQIVNTNVGTTTGFIKNGTGSLFLGGTVANTFAGTSFLNAGKIIAGKADALGAGNALIMAGGTLETGGFSQALGTLDLNGGTSMIDFGAGTVAVSFAKSSALDWGGFSLILTNWTSGSDTLQFGTDSTGLTPLQLQQIHFTDPALPNAQINGNGFITPVIPEPSVAAVIVAGLFVLVVGRRVFLRRS